MVVKREDAISFLWYVQILNIVFGVLSNFITTLSGAWSPWWIVLPIAIYASVMSLIYLLEHLITD